MENSKIASPNVIDLFCGAGGFSKGFEMADYNILLGVDHWKKAKKTYENNHKNAKFLLEDIQELSFKDIKDNIGKKEVDVVIGGPPCQGFSISGKRKKEDPRNQLVFQYANLVKKVNPKVFVMENVVGLKSLDQGKFLDMIIKDLKKAGYKHIDYRVLNAADYGVPQLRKRIFLIGNRIGEEVSFPKSKCNESEYITLREAISDLPSLKENLNLKGKVMEYKTPPQNAYQKLMRRKSYEVYNHTGTNHWDKTVKMISMVPEGGNWRDIPKEFREKQNFNARYTRFDGDKPSTTVDTGHRHHFHYEENRVPTVRENARRQSFPDDFIFFESKTSQYKQVGNAVPCLLAKAIGEELKNIL